MQGSAGVAVALIDSKGDPEGETGRGEYRGVQGEGRPVRTLVTCSSFLAPTSGKAQTLLSEAAVSVRQRYITRADT